MEPVYIGTNHDLEGLNYGNESFSDGKEFKNGHGMLLSERFLYVEISKGLLPASGFNWMFLVVTPSR